MSLMSNLNVGGNSYEIKDATARTDIGSLNTAVAAVNARIDNLTGRGKILLIGDSIAAVTDNDGKTFYELFIEYLGYTLNTDAFTSAISSRGFTTSYTPKGNFKEMFDDFWTDNPTENPLDYGAIIVTGGANDISQTPATIEAAIDTFIQDVKATCANAKIYIGVNSRNSVNGNGTRGFKNNYLPGYKTCEKYGAIFLHGLEYVLFNSSYQYDHLHPNSDGIAVLALGLYSAYTTGEAHIITQMINDAANFTLGSGVASVTNLKCLSEFQCDDIIRIGPADLSSVVITMTGSYTGGDVFIGYNDNNISFNGENVGLPIMFPPVKYVDTSNNSHEVYDAILYKNANEWHLGSPTGFTNAKTFTIQRIGNLTMPASLLC